MAGMSRLQETPKGYRHRWTCPRGLEGQFETHELRRSLGTKKLREAELRNAEATRLMETLEGRARRGQTITDAEIETAFRFIRAGLPADPRTYAQGLARRWGEECLSKHFAKFSYRPRSHNPLKDDIPDELRFTPSIFNWLEEEGISIPSGLRDIVIWEASKEEAYASSAWRARGELSILQEERPQYTSNNFGTPDAQQQVIRTLPGPDLTNGMTIREAVSRWKSIRKPKWSSEQAAEASLEIWTSCHGNTRVAEITPSMVDEYVAQIKRMPDRRLSAFNALPPLEAIAAADREDIKERLSGGSVVRLTGFLTASIELLVPRMLMNNPFRGALKGMKSTPRKKKPFTDEQLRSIFTHPPYTAPLPTERNARWWLPVVLAFTGARREEIAQLLTSDIKHERGIWYFHITETDDDEKSGGLEKSIKNENSKRRVPIHSELIRLGILNHVNEALNDKHVRLWSDLKPNKRGQFGATIGGKLNLWIKERVGQAAVLHQFRATFISKLSEFNVSGEHRRALCGHAIDGVKPDVHDIHYNVFPIKTLKSAIESLSYDFKIG